jgi:hypothetical protein
MNTQTQMSGVEKFGFISGIIGLIADLIGLTTFVLGFWSFQQPDTTGVAIPTLVKILSAVVWLYGWAAISWFLIRRSFVQRNRPQDFNCESVTTNVVTYIGAFVLPIYWLWAWPFWVEFNTPAQVPNEEVMKYVNTIQPAWQGELIGFAAISFFVYYGIGALVVNILGLMPYLYSDMPLPKPSKEPSS